METQAASGVASPCVGICVLDAETDICKGCWRSLDEVAAWASADDARRREIVAAARQRKTERNQ